MSSTRAEEVRFDTEDSTTVSRPVDCGGDSVIGVLFTNGDQDAASLSFEANFIGTDDGFHDVLDINTPGSALAIPGGTGFQAVDPRAILGAHSLRITTSVAVGSNRPGIYLILKSF